jgi:hypothetical protein
MARCGSAPATTFDCAPWISIPAFPTKLQQLGRRSGIGALVFALGALVAAFLSLGASRDLPLHRCGALPLFI